MTSLAMATWMLASAVLAAAETPPGAVQVVDGIVQPRRPVAEAIATAMQFLKKADGAYVPGRLDGELAGYFTSAHVNPDGTRSDRKLSFPARQHAYFITTFLMYYAYRGEEEWLVRAQDLGDWNLAHRTPAAAAWPNLPYSTFSDGKPGGSRDRDSIEPDKAAFFGSDLPGLARGDGGPQVPGCRAGARRNTGPHAARGRLVAFSGHS